MTDPNPSPPADDDDAAGTDREATGGLARWQKAVGLVGLVVVAALVILLLVGDHSPGRHVPGGEGGQSADVEADAGHDPSPWTR